MTVNLSVNAIQGSVRRFFLGLGRVSPSNLFFHVEQDTFYLHR